MLIRKITSFAMLAISLSVGCNRAYYRKQADRDVAYVITQKSSDPRWGLPGFNVEVDPRSRYFDPYDPDCSPMPEDDPASHQFMQCVDGMKGWKRWHDNGMRSHLENPAWREHLAQYAPINEKGEVILSLDSALRLAYIHSPQYQQTLETLYLTALDVTTERFRYETQFFGSNTSLFTAVDGGSSARTDTDFQLRKRFATAGNLLVGFANEFVWTFTGANTNSTMSLLNFSLVHMPTGTSNLRSRM